MVLGMLLGLQPIVTDLFLPALPEIRGRLDATPAATQWTMSGLMMAFGIGQLLWGPVADRFGRRPVLIASLSMLMLAAIGSSTSGSMPALIAWRVAQGASLAAVIMCGRAIVRDLYEPTEGAMVMSRAMSVLGMMAIVSPALGGMLASLLGWRGALLGVAAITAAALVVIARSWPETAVPNPRAMDVAPYFRQLVQIASHPGFRAHALLVCCTYGGLFVFLSASAFVYIGWLGLSPAAYGGVMALASVAYLVGTAWCRWLIPRHGVAGAVRIGSFATLIAAVWMAAAAWFESRSVAALLAPQLLYHVAHGVHQPCGQAGTVAGFPRAAGVASSLAGFAMSACAVATGFALGYAMDGTPRAMLWGVAAWALLTAATGLTLVQRHGGGR